MQKRLSLLLLFALALLLTLPLFAPPTTYYVDPAYTGGGSTGTSSHPFTSLSSAWSAINAALASGPVTVNFSATQSQNVQISLASRTNTSTNILTLDGASFKNTNETTPSWVANATFAPCTGEECAKNASWMTGSKYVVTSTTPIEGNDNVNSCLGYFTIQGFNFHNTEGQSADLAYVHDITFQYNELTRTATGTLGPGLFAGPGQHGPCNASSSNVGGPDNVTLQYNYIHATWGECIYIGASTSDPPGGPGSAEYTANGMTCGTNCSTGANYLIQGNTAESCASWGGQGDGSDIKDGHANLQEIGNTFKPSLACTSCGSNGPGNDGQGIPFESGVLISGNWIEAPGHDGIAVFASWNNAAGRSTLNIENNIIVNVKSGIGHNGGIDQQSPSAASIWAALGIYNNSIYLTNDPCIEIESGNAVGSVTAENNIASSCGLGGITGGVLFATHDYNDCYNTTSCPAETHGITSNPLFVSTTPPYSDTNFEIQSGSPARGVGANLHSLFTTDYFGNTRPNSAFDIGANQLTTSSQAAAPSCAPGAGTYASTQTVTCTNPNGGTAVLCYTVNGATPATNGDGATCATGTVYSATLVVSATQTLKAIAGTSTLTDSSVVSYAYVISVQKVKPLAFSMMFNATANIPSGGVIDCGLTRLHDADSTRWGLIDTSTGTGAGQTSYTFTNLDAFLADVYTACGSIPAHYTLEATPANALTNTSPTPACAMDMGSGGCQPPKDLNSDGTGANLWFRNFVAAIATHVKAVGYSGTHAVPEYWEVWNEVDQSCQLNTALTSPSCAANFYAGTYAQLKRMTEDTRCIIKGVGSITATGETCAQVRATVKSVALSAPVDGAASIVLTSAHTYTAAAIAVTQNLLYCNDSPKSGSACDGIGMHNAIDIVNTHLKPCQAPCDVSSNFVEADTAGYVQALLGTEQSAELAKPQWIGEGGYSGTGWPGSGTYADNQMQQSVMLRYFLIAMTNGIRSISWYTYDISNTLQGNSLNTDGWNRAYSWLNNKGFGSVVGGVPTSNSGCTLSGSLWSCSITDNVTNFLILWDQSKSCSGGSCTTANQSVSLAYTQYTDINGTVFGGIAGTVPVGIQPILLQVVTGTKHQVTITENILATSDVLTRSAAYKQGLSETLSTSAPLSVSFAGNISLAEDLTTTDVVAALVFGARVSLSDSVTTSDALSRIPVYKQALSDSLSTSASMTTSSAANVTISEALTTSDVMAVTGNFVLALSETLTTSDVLLQQNTFQVLSDSLTTNEILVTVHGSQTVVPGSPSNLLGTVH